MSLKNLESKLKIGISSVAALGMFAFSGCESGGGNRTGNFTPYNPPEQENVKNFCGVAVLGKKLSDGNYYYELPKDSGFQRELKEKIMTLSPRLWEKYLVNGTLPDVVYMIYLPEGGAIVHYKE